MPHSQEFRAAGLAVLAAFALIVATCLPFLLTGTDVPDIIVVLGRLLPGIASLGAILLVLGRGHLARLWRLRPASPGELVRSYGLALVVMLPVLVVPALLGVLLGAELKPAGTLAAAVPTILVGAVVFAFSTLGEEVLWRGQLQTAARQLGFWRSSAVIGIVWLLWHLPLHLTYLTQGALSWAEFTAATVGIAAWSPLLAALVERRGTIWPAVFAHAVPLSSLQLLSESTAERVVVFWAVTTLGWAAMLGAAAVVRARTLSRVGADPRPAERDGVHVHGEGDQCSGHRSRIGPVQCRDTVALTTWWEAPLELDITGRWPWQK